MIKRGSQKEYNKLLDAFNADLKTKKESIGYLLGLGYSNEQAKNAVHVYWKGGEIKATFIMSRNERNNLLDNFKAYEKAPRDCVKYLMNCGCTYRQANSAVYKYRQERGLIA